jgi:predicted MPP superfamily phosphohydrolase
MNEILLRFRDTGDVDTIKEHQKVIDNKKYVLWGWWKKDSEPERTSLINDLKNNIGFTDYFLFDRSQEHFYAITVEELFFEDGRPIACPDPVHAPPYYQSEALSLWFKITNIKELTLETFLKRFTIVPTKDYTFFTRKDIEGELSDRAQINKRIKLQSDYILHLSDIHFGSDFGFPATTEPSKRPLYDIITDYIGTVLQQKIGLLIISGDITSRAETDPLFNEGLLFLNKLCQFLGLGKEAVIIIPGNHDIPFENAKFTSYSHENIYRQFLKNFYGSDTELYGLHFFELPCGQKLDILRMHSVRLRKKEESNYGYVDWYLYKNLLSKYKLDGDIKVAVIHHHLVSMPAEEILDTSYPYGSISTTIDAGRVIEGLQLSGFHFVLNGHQHIPGITKVARGIKDDQNEIRIEEKDNLTILSAGSAGVASKRFSNEMQYNSFSIYAINKTSLIVEVRYFNPSIDPKRYYKAELPLRM